jgi:hypothetical protein
MPAPARHLDATVKSRSSFAIRHTEVREEASKHGIEGPKELKTGIFRQLDTWG